MEAEIFKKENDVEYLPAGNRNAVSGFLSVLFDCNGSDRSRNRYKNAHKTPRECVLAPACLVKSHKDAILTSRAGRAELLRLMLLFTSKPPRGVFTRFLRDQTQAIRIIAWATCAKPLFFDFCACVTGHGVNSNRSITIIGIFFGKYIDTPRIIVYNNTRRAGIAAPEMYRLPKRLLRI